MKFEWEELKDESCDHFTTLRAKIFGGWLVRTNEFTFGELSIAESEALVFVPDPKHEWVIDNE